MTPKDSTKKSLCSLSPGDALAEIERLRDSVLELSNRMLHADAPPGQTRPEVLTRRFQRASAAMSAVRHAADALSELAEHVRWMEDQIAGRPDHADVSRVEMEDDGE